jgi:hypothetical protein
MERAHWKTVKGRFIEWAGVWEGHAIRFTTEPKLLDKTIHFMTSSNARIQFQRDLGPCYVDLVVLGYLEPLSLGRLRRLAQSNDTRQVCARCSRRGIK